MTTMIGCHTAAATATIEHWIQRTKRLKPSIALNGKPITEL